MFTAEEEDQAPLFLIIGTKIDNAAVRQVPQEQAQRFATDLKSPYIECSALKNIGIQDIFQVAV
jgi:hypothetical protein